MLRSQAAAGAFEIPIQGRRPLSGATRSGVAAPGPRCAAHHLLYQTVGDVEPRWAVQRCPARIAYRRTQIQQQHQSHAK